MGGGTTYTIIRNADQDAGGMVAPADIGVPESVPPHWMSYIAVDDDAARTGKVASLGGKVRKEPFDIPNVGRMRVVAHPTGAVVCLITLSGGGG
ncbi:MAG: hypothetical protein ACREH3_07455 [Geminicoccales bacterium]